VPISKIVQLCERSSSGAIGNDGSEASFNNLSQAMFSVNQPRLNLKHIYVI